MRRNKSKANNEGWLTSYADLITNLLIFFILIISVSQIQTGKFEKVVAELSEGKKPTNLQSAQASVKEELKRQGLENAVSVELTDDGLELAFDSGVTFPSGSAEILPQMKDPLAKVLAVLTNYQDYQFAVEGHTDERPITGGIYKSNWELSSARALVVRSQLQSVGIAKENIRVEAYADNKALDPEITAGLDRESLLAKHRRVVVRLY